MRRLAFVVLIFAAGAIVAVWLALNPGTASFTFHGRVAETTFSWVVVFVVILSLILALIWRGAGWLLGLPSQIRRASARARAQRGYDALERALIASAAGDGGRARRQAARAGELLDRPLLTRVISARAAEAAGELESAEADYRLLLESPETQIVGLRGLAQAALTRGDWAEAKRQSATAFSRNPQARWAFETLFDAQVRTAEWAPALVTLAEGERHGHVSELAARRRRAVLLTAEATDAEIACDLDHARERAVTAAQTCPEFPPASALAARLLQRDGQTRKARKLLEDAWRAAPHPALAMRWRELSDPGAAARAEHMEKLIAISPEHRESRILAAETALARGEPAAAEAALAPLSGPRTARLCALAARIAEERGDHDAARALVLEGVGAPGEPDWSDVDPDGPAFAYLDEDWARLVFVFGDEGRLIHPRHDRFEPELIAAPSLRLLAPPAPKPEPKPAPAPEPKGEPQPAPAPPPEPQPESPPPAAPPVPPAPAKAEAEPTPPSPDDPGPGAAEEDEEDDPEQRFRSWD